MEFLRFGSSIPGSYWGCCAVCIIQNFKCNPDEKAAIQIVNGDGGQPKIKNGKSVYAGPTYRDIFKTRIRVGTFGTNDMPNHAFLAVLTDSQVSSGYGKKWMEILKEEGFEFIRCVDNSVYTGSSVIEKPGTGDGSSHKNYLFGLFRNIGQGAVENPYDPPKGWKKLGDTLPEVNAVGDTGKELNEVHQAYQLERWKVGKTVEIPEGDPRLEGVPLTMAGVRSEFPQELQTIRQGKLDAKKTKSSSSLNDAAAKAFG